MKKNTKIGVVGAGLMGHGIAQVFASRGYSVTVFASDRESLVKVQEKIRNHFNVFVELNMVNEDDVEQCLENIHLTDNLKVLSKEAHVIIEAISENLNIKRKLFSELEQYVPQDAILCTNTSSISITEISEALDHKARFLGTHFWNPPHIMPCVEVIKGKYTSDTVFETIFELMKKVNKEPVRVLKDIPGFIGNRLQYAMLREAVSLVEKNIASPEDIDKVTKYGFGLRLAFVGPLETIDMAGLDLVYDIYKYLVPYLDNSSTPFAVLKNMVEQGAVGVRSNKGFYEWPKEKIENVMNERDYSLLKILNVIFPQDKHQ